MTISRLSTPAALLCLFVATQSAAFNLITEDEARLPSAYQEGKRAGLTRGPGIDVASPVGTVQKNGVALKVQFKSRGGVAIDPKTVRVVYMKNPAVDLTDRIRTHVSGTGIELGGAQVPPGAHQLRVEVGDAEGRVSSKLVDFNAQ